MGDSRLSWTFENDKATFWPEWFADEEFFANTRIHTWGYHEPSVNGRASVSKLRDIGVTLCSALDTNTYVKSNGQVCLEVNSLAGFSTGTELGTESNNLHSALTGRPSGQSSESNETTPYSRVCLTLEKTIRNAKLKDQDLANRFHTILFLATPHRDVEDRDMLKRILRECNTEPASVEVLEPDPNTAVLKEINDEFLATHSGLRIYSFYEICHEPVVEKRRALLGEI